MLDGITDDLEVPIALLNVLKRPASFSAEPLQTMFDHMMYTFPGEEVLKVEGNRKLWNETVTHGVERLDRDDRDA